LVWLILETAGKEAIRGKNFNSTLVWLILTFFSTNTPAINPFQFHIGMINPNFSSESAIYKFLFQFHIGMINPKLFICAVNESLKISIPHWYD